MNKCIKYKAGCSLNWDNLREKDKQLLANKYNTSVSNMGQAFDNV